MLGERSERGLSGLKYALAGPPIRGDSLGEESVVEVASDKESVDVMTFSSPRSSCGSCTWAEVVASRSSGASSTTSGVFFLYRSRTIRHKAISATPTTRNTSIRNVGGGVEVTTNRWEQ